MGNETAAAAETKTPPTTPPPPTPTLVTTPPIAEGTTPGTEVKDGAPAPKPVVPEKYELKLPENSHLDSAHLEKIASYAKEQGLSNDQAQRLVERENLAIASFVEQSVAGHKARANEWVNEIKTDKDFGGEAFNQNVELAKRVVNRFGDENFRKALDESGFGNHPGLVRLLVRIGKGMSNDQLIHPGSQPGKKKSMEERLYPSMYKGNNE